MARSDVYLPSHWAGNVDYSGDPRLMSSTIYSIINCSNSHVVRHSMCQVHNCILVASVGQYYNIIVNLQYEMP